MEKKCKVENCCSKGRLHKNGNYYLIKGFCNTHYSKLLKYGDASFVKKVRGENRGNNELYKTYLNMKTRCLNPNNSSYKNYGGRGITICNRRVGIHGFSNFYEDVGKKPSKQYSLDRIDNNGGYCKENCTRSTKHQQASNRRTNNKTVGVSYCKINKLWRSILRKDKKMVLNKYFKTEKEAIKERKKAEKTFIT